MALLDDLKQRVTDGDAPGTVALTKELMASGVAPETILNDGLIAAMAHVGQLFESGEYFVPEMLVSARAMKGALELLRPALAAANVQAIGKIVIGTVQGDLHDIGKNLVAMMMEGAGFEVIDLGVNVPPEKFVKTVEEQKPDVLGFSAFLTTTMPMIKVNIEALKKAGLRDKVKIMAGGAPVTAHYAEISGADGYAPDASATARLAKQFVGAEGDAPGGALAEAVSAVEKMVSVAEPL